MLRTRVACLLPGGQIDQHTGRMQRRRSPRPRRAGADVGCGCDALTLSAADQVGPDGEAWGVDISEPMLAQSDPDLLASTLTEAGYHDRTPADHSHP